MFYRKAMPSKASWVIINEGKQKESKNYFKQIC